MWCKSHGLLYGKTLYYETGLIFYRARKIEVIVTRRFIFLQVMTVQNCGEIAAQSLSLHSLALFDVYSSNMVPFKTQSGQVSAQCIL